YRGRDRAAVAQGKEPRRGFRAAPLVQRHLRPHSRRLALCVRPGVAQSPGGGAEPLTLALLARMTSVMVTLGALGEHGGCPGGAPWRRRLPLPSSTSVSLPMRGTCSTPSTRCPRGSPC